VAVATLISPKILVGTAWTGTAPGISNPTVTGTISSSTDLSAWCKEVSLPETVAMQDSTTFGAGGFAQNVPGLSSMSVTLTFYQDFAATATYATLASLALAKTLTYWDVNGTTSARSATNPSLVFAAYIATFDFLSAAVGNVPEVPLALTITGKWGHLIV
jgi:hypothetical protein